jgi:phosphoglucomutase
MEAGFTRMNNVTVMQASQGLSDYVKTQTTNRTVVIGHDHRFHSREFAHITATAFLLSGFTVYYLESSQEAGEYVPTPLVPFAVDYFQAAAGVMITASHNPALDNGYKVYWSNGCQIIPPHDHEIAAAILDNLAPVKDAYETGKVMNIGLNNGTLKYVKEEVVTAYLLHINSALVKSNVSDLRFVYTPMHGVGLEVFTKAAKFLGITNVISVKKQSQPDPSFPTVKFPNPEEKGALELSQILADEIGVDLVLANDPDADRFTAAVKVDGQWRQLTGNELGFLFADYIYSTFDSPADRLYFVNSTVSSQMIESMASVLGMGYTDTLTGFKWIGNKAIDLESKGYKVPFGFEEAIGYMFQGIHDKDGIAAAVVFLQMAQNWKTKGISALDVLQTGFEKYGYFKEYNSYYTVPDLSLIPDIFNSIREDTTNELIPYPQTVGPYTVTYWRDLTTGYQSDTEDNLPTLPVDPSSQMITAKLSTGKDGEVVRFTMRGSGTEPKLKVYIEARAGSEADAAWLAADVWEQLRNRWFRPQDTGLVESQN